MSRANGASAIGAAGLGTGAALTAGVASTCCVGPALAPVFLSVLGASGLASVSGLRPFTPWLLLGSALMLGFSFWSSYRRPACADGIAPPISRAAHVARVVTWLAAVLWIISAAYSAYGFLNE
ncbi:MAG: mercuric transporter MerT family protein [Candidatus Cybelea sp.]